MKRSLTYANNEDRCCNLNWTKPYTSEEKYLVVGVDRKVDFQRRLYEADECDEEEDEVELAIQLEVF